MAFREVKVCDKLPEKLSKFQKLSFLDIQRDSSFIGKYVQGIIDKKWALVSAGNKKRMKMILAEGAGNGDDHPPSKINVFLIGAFAEEFLEFTEGDTVIISEARFQKSPTFEKDDIHPCLIIVENACARPSVWVIPAKKTSKKNTSARTHARTVTNPTTFETRPPLTNSTSTSSSNNLTATAKLTATSSTSHKQVPNSRDTGGSKNRHVNKNRDKAVLGQTISPTSNDGPSTSAANQDSGASTSKANQDSGASTSKANQDSGASTSKANQESGALNSTANQSTSRGDNQTSGHPGDAWTVPNAGTPTKQKTYNYTTLKDLNLESVVNIFGVVKFFKPPYRTKGTDFCLTVTVIDPSINPDERGLRCQLFHEDIKALPQVYAVGDIVRFHRLKITEFGGSVQGQKSHGFHCLVFDGQLDGSLVPRSTSPNYTLTDDDKQKVTQLRQWGSNQTQLVIDNHNCTLSKMYTSQYLDLVCQVISVAPLRAEDRCTVVRVWDGTHYKRHVRVMDTSCAMSIHSDSELVNKSGVLALDVSMYDNHMETGARLKPGQFIKICNLHAAKYRPPGKPDETTDIIELVLHGGTAYGRGVITLMEWQQAVGDMIQRMNEVTENDLNTIASANQNAVAPVHITQPLNNGQPSTSFQNGTAPRTTNENVQKSATDDDAHVLHAASVCMDDDIDYGPSTSGLSSRNAGVTALVNVATTNSQSTSSSKQGTPNRCMQRSATVLIEHFQQKTTRIADVITSEAPSKFRIRAKVTNYFPHDASNFTHLYCRKCKYKARVPSKSTAPKQTNTQVEDTNNAQETMNSRGPYNLRNLAARTETSQKQNENRPGVLTRSAADKMLKQSSQGNNVGTSPSQKNTKASDNSSMEKVSPGRKGIRRKHPSSKDLENEEAALRPKKSGKCTSKTAAPTDHEGAVSTEGEVGGAVDSDGEKLPSTDAQRKTTGFDLLGNVITAELQEFSEKTEEGGKNKKRPRRRVFVNVNGLTVHETLLMARKFKHLRFIHHPDLPKVKGHPIRGHGSSTSQPIMVYYFCPRCSPKDGSDASENGHLLEYQYCVNVVLDDGTGSVEVFLLREHAQMFFKDIAATNLHLCLETKFILEDAMAKLCPYPITEGNDISMETDLPPIRNLTSHPWIDCCVMSYRVNLGGTETVMYQMFDTSLALDIE